MLDWVPIPFSRGSSQLRDRTQVSHLAGRFFTTEPQVKFKIVSVYKKISKSNKWKRKAFVKIGKKKMLQCLARDWGEEDEAAPCCLIAFQVTGVDTAM